MIERNTLQEQSVRASVHGTFFVKRILKKGAMERQPFDRVLYEALHVSHNRRCSIDVTDLADIFTVGRANIFRKKPKISAQTDQPVWRYIGHNF
jgi:hypothetical protein